MVYGQFFVLFLFDIFVCLADACAQRDKDMSINLHSTTITGKKYKQKHITNWFFITDRFFVFRLPVRDRSVVIYQSTLPNCVLAYSRPRIVQTSKPNRALHRGLVRRRYKALFCVCMKRDRCEIVYLRRKKNKKTKSKDGSPSLWLMRVESAL